MTVVEPSPYALAGRTRPGDDEKRAAIRVSTALMIPHQAASRSSS